MTAMPTIPTRRMLAPTLLCIATLATHATPAHAQANAHAATQAPTPAAKKQTTLWIDVRTPAEFAQGHIEGAINIPLDRIAQHVASHAPDTDAPIAVYCRSGNRSEQARHILQSMGYATVRNEGAYGDLMHRGVKAQ